MDFENNIPKFDGTNAKQKILDQIRLEVDTITDALGEKIDAGIKEAVIYCKALGLETDMSCEGHSGEDGEHSNHLPYVTFEAPGSPEYPYEGQKEIFERVAKENNITVDDLRRQEKYESLLYSAWDEMGDNPKHTEAYEEWAKKQSDLFDRIRNLLEEFYQARVIELEKKLIMVGNREAVFRVTNHGGVHDNQLGDEFLYLNHAKIKEKEEDLIRLLPDFQAEMQAFTEFLKEKFLATN